MEPAHTVQLASPIGEDLSIAIGSIAANPSQWFSIDADQSLSTLSTRFRELTSAFAAMVLEHGQPLGVISRDALGQHLSHPFGNALFLNRPIRVTLAHWAVPMLMLDSTASLSSAIRQVLARPPAFRYEPVIIRHLDGKWTLVEAYDLLLEQCAELNKTLIDLREQRTATEASEKEREQLQKQLIDASRVAGRAEVATGVLHNVGNVLNSVNVSVSMLQRLTDSTKLPNLARTLEVFNQNRNRLGEFFSTDEKARHVVPFLEKLNTTLVEEQQTIKTELARLVESVDHIKQVVQMQQDYARGSTFSEPVRPAAVAEEALRINAVSFDRHNVKVSCEFEDIPPLPLDKHKLLQVLINLVSNAKNATKHRPSTERQIHVRIDTPVFEGIEQLRFRVTDNGVGIARENLAKLFGHGFTTRRDGHGFGLHSSANAAAEMGGTLTVESDGLDRGATFTLQVPIKLQQIQARAA
jgi:signal transduction histidine kinase